MFKIRVMTPADDGMEGEQNPMLEIKRATPEDAQAAFDIRLQAIRSQCIGAYTREQMMLWTRGTAEDGYSVLMDKPFYLGWVQGEPVVTGMLDPHNNEVGALFVLPGFTGRGYGKAMLDHLEHVARELAIDEVVLDATLNAASFYQACGYVGTEQAAVGVGVGVYSDEEKDCAESCGTLMGASRFPVGASSLAKVANTNAALLVSHLQWRVSIAQMCPQAFDHLRH